MDGVRDFLEEVQKGGHSRGNFLGLLNVLIGRRLTKADGTVVSAGLTWREAAAVLKKVRWDKAVVRELGQDPAALPPRDRERFWYSAIAHANVGSDEATAAGDRLAQTLQAAGYVVGPPPNRE